MKLKYAIRTAIFLIVAIVITFGVLAIIKFPKMEYTIKTSDITSGIAEKPMDLSFDKGKRELKFDVIFEDDKDNSDSAKLITKPVFVRYAPFYTYSDELTIQLINKDQLSSKDRAIYEVSGVIEGIKTGNFRVKIIDPNSNLIDEKYINIQ